MQERRATTREGKGREKRGAMGLSCVALLAALLTLTACQGQVVSTGSTEGVKLVITPVPTPTATQAAQPTAAPVTYTVKTGDTLSGIADLFGVTVDDIVRSNNIADANSLQIGQALTIPQRQSGTAASATAGGTGTPGTPGIASGTAGPATAGTITPILVAPTGLPLYATPPQGPTVPEPQTGSDSSVSPSISPSISPTIKP